MPPRTLSVVPTPLGNLGDLTRRAVETLATVDLILAEDTRVTRKLLSHCDIHTALQSFPAHREALLIPGVLERLERGAHIALVSDAGMPGIADPGAALIRAIRDDESLTLEVLPGPNAVITALVAAGFGDALFSFLGWIPRQKADRHRLWARIAASDTVTICFEAPSRVEATLADALAVLGPAHEAAFARELTKRFEEIRRGPLAAVAAHVAATPARGEYVLLFGPGNTTGTAAPPSSENPAALAAELIAAGLSARNARAILARLTGLTTSGAYALLVEAQNNARSRAT